MTADEPPPPKTDDPTGMQFPEMRQALLTNEDLVALVADLTAFTRIDEVLEKTRGTAQSTAGQVTLSAACERLVAGHTIGVQIRYYHQDFHWTDTIIAASSGYRLVRIRHDENITR
jgi:hypothetical protein